MRFWGPRRHRMSLQTFLFPAFHSTQSWKEVKIPQGLIEILIQCCLTNYADFGQVLVGAVSKHMFFPPLVTVSILDIEIPCWFNHQ